MYKIFFSILLLIAYLYFLLFKDQGYTFIFMFSFLFLVSFFLDKQGVSNLNENNLYVDRKQSEVAFVFDTKGFYVADDNEEEEFGCWIEVENYPVFISIDEDDTSSEYNNFVSRIIDNKDKINKSLGAFLRLNISEEKVLNDVFLNDISIYSKKPYTAEFILVGYKSNYIRCFINEELLFTDFIRELH